MLIKELNSIQKVFVQECSQEMTCTSPGGRRDHFGASTEQNALSRAEKQMLTHTCWVSLIYLVPREASWTENNTRGLISAKTNLWWKNQNSGCLGGRKKLPRKEEEGVFWGWWKYPSLKGVKVIWVCLFAKNVRLRFVPFSVRTSYTPTHTKD